VAAPRDRDDARAAVALAAEHGVPILPRGGGTSLAGQTVGAALVLDFSKHMNRLLELDAGQRWARVEPGLVRDELNARLAEHGLCFAPDPATSSRANVGGMIGNNSSGTKSILYGKTIDPFRRLVPGAGAAHRLPHRDDGGFARGIDAAAHRDALAALDGRTVAVLRPRRRLSAASARPGGGHRRARRAGLGVPLRRRAAALAINPTSRASKQCHRPSLSRQVFAKRPALHTPDCPPMPSATSP
jgi:FAD/FMN-containing dehydrogenase